MGTISGSNFIKAVGFSGMAGDTATLRIRFYDARLISAIVVPGLLKFEITALA